MYNGKRYKLDDFSGGYCGNLPVTKLQTNQANDLDNIVILPGGQGWRTRWGRSWFANPASQSIYGLGYFLKANQSEWLVAITSGAKIFVDAGFTGTFVDKTGVVSVTTNTTDSWSFLTFNDTLICFGAGLGATPVAPFKYTGSGNCSLLGGSPPSAYGAFTVNNRVFAYRTSSNPSTIYWSVLANAEDWTSTGSGSATVGSLSSNQNITGHAVLGANNVLIFKENSIYQMITTSAPFPIFSLFDTVGTINKDTIINVDGMVYFLTSKFQLYATDGNTTQLVSDKADDLLSAMAGTSTALIRGFRQKGKDYDWVVFTGATQSGGAPVMAVAWDLINKCWLKHTRGYTGQTTHIERVTTGAHYVGNFNNDIYTLDNTNINSDADSSSTSTNFTGYWQTGVLNPSVVSEIVQVKSLTCLYKTASGSSNIVGTYGFNGGTLSGTFTNSQNPVASEAVGAATNFLSGRGNLFQFKISSTAAASLTYYGSYLAGKTYGQKRFTSN